MTIEPEHIMTETRCRQLHDEQNTALEHRLQLGTEGRKLLREELLAMRQATEKELDAIKGWNRALTGTFVLTIIGMAGWLLINGSFAKMSDLIATKDCLAQLTSDINVIKVTQEHQQKNLDALVRELKAHNGKVK